MQNTIFRQRVAEQNLHALRCSIAEQKRENEFEKKLSGHRKNIIKVTLLSVRKQIIEFTILTITIYYHKPIIKVKAVLSYCNNKAMQMEEKFAKSYKILLDLEKLLASSKDLKELKLVTSDETVASLAAMYRIGDLGFTPPSSEMTVSEQQIGVIMVIIETNNHITPALSIYFFRISVRPNRVSSKGPQSPDQPLSNVSKKSLWEVKSRAKKVLVVFGVSTLQLL